MQLKLSACFDLFCYVELAGAGFGPGIPGLQVGFGVGVGCGVGVGFGYGLGRGVAQDENRRYSNIANLDSASTNFPTR